MYECDINHWSRRDMSALIYQAKCLMLVISTCWLFAYSKTLIRRRILFVRILLITRRWRSFLLSHQQLCRLDYTHLPFFSIRFRHHHLLLLATAACAFTKKNKREMIIWKERRRYQSNLDIVGCWCTRLPPRPFSYLFVCKMWMPDVIIRYYPFLLRVVDFYNKKSEYDSIENKKKKGLICFWIQSNLRGLFYLFDISLVITFL